MKDMTITDNIRFVGVDDLKLDMFESQYHIPDGISYNSYVILDEKTAILDTVDYSMKDEWLSNLERELGGKEPDYLIISHMESDHSGSIALLADKYPNMKIAATAKAFQILGQFFEINLEGRKIVASEGDTLSLGKHTLQFIMAPMIHWPEVMMTYEQSEKILFTADAFGTFGALCNDIPWEDEARRYYINIVGKYGMQVQAVLKKAAALDIQTICPLHGPVLKENLSHYISLYDTWSSYRPETEGVLVAYASIHGHTKEAALKFADMLKDKGAVVEVRELMRDDMAGSVAAAFRYSKLAAFCPTYDGNLYPAMEDFLYHLKVKTFRSRKVALVENGSWALSAGRLMKEYFTNMKDITLCENMVSIKSAAHAADYEKMAVLADELLG